jgi:hypothetical protein
MTQGDRRSSTLVIRPLFESAQYASELSSLMESDTQGLQLRTTSPCGLNLNPVTSLNTSRYDNSGW